ncbi:transposase [Cerasibacillus terrae]|uniref:Transposase n=1 Tax=Cerasibacillus terrae TaxID=2498845 RepID=A0A5C8NWS0_9BACI|nr:transposase [Cerasibacillus terrae]TXL65635.1 transposase [Cerasibacillus terrae]
MAKYSYEFKLKIIKGYPGNSLGYKLLAKKYDIPNKSPIDRWVVHIKHAKKSSRIIL